MTRVLSPTRKSKLPKEVEALAKQKNAETIKNADGSVTKRRVTEKTSKQLTTAEGKLLEKSVTFDKHTSTKRGEADTHFEAKTDLIGRDTLSSTHDFTSNSGVHTVTTKTTDVWGTDKQTKLQEKSAQLGNTFESSIRSSSKDSRGNHLTSSDLTWVTSDEKSTVTRTEQRTKGTDLQTRSSAVYEDGKFTLSDGADWSKTNSIEKSRLTETAYDPSNILKKTDKASEWVGKIFKGLGLEQQWSHELGAELMHEKALYEGKNSRVDAQYGVSGGQQLTIDGEGIRGNFNRTAQASVTAQAHGQVEGRYGSASYDAQATAQASASIDASGKIDANGLDARVQARAGASVTAEITARAQSKSVTVLGTDLNASVEGYAKATLAVEAEATGTVQVTRHPPTAIVKGEAGASAVAKIEGEFRASAGPFTVVANGYASAGAEAKAWGVFGFEDGKIKIGGGAGAALGVGLGGGATVEIDVKMIGEMAKNAADLNHDGKLGWGDAFAALGMGSRLLSHWHHHDHPAAAKYVLPMAINYFDLNAIDAFRKRKV